MKIERCENCINYEPYSKNRGRCLASAFTVFYSQQDEFVRTHDVYAMVMRMDCCNKFHLNIK
jgi:hypothetical protein